MNTKIWLSLIIITVLALHFALIMNPNHVVSDEKYYVPDARSILAGDGSQLPEHTSLGKLIITAGLLVFGDNPFGWRFFSVVFGTISILLFFLICKKLEMGDKPSLFATFLFAFEEMSFILASVAWLDVFMVIFMLGSFLLYLHDKDKLSAGTLALSILAKATGALIVFVMFWLSKLKRGLIYIIILSVAFIAGLFTIESVAFGGWQFPVDRVMKIASMGSSLTFGNINYQAASRPWEWILHPVYLNLWHESIDYYLFISWTIGALAIPAALYLVYKMRKGSIAARFAFCWFAATYLIWIPLDLITNRITFVYYFYPTVGALCIGITLMLFDLVKVRRHFQYGLWAYGVAHLTIFVMFYPLTKRLVF